MYIGPWQEYALSKALAQSRLAEPGPATPRLGRLSASHGRSFTPDSSLPTPLALGSGRASARSQRIREGRGSGGGRGRGSQLEKRQQLQRMQKMYGMRGLARTLDVARAEEGGGADALPEVRLSPHARTEPALPPYRTPSAAYLPPEEVGERLLGWVPSPSPREPGRPSKTARPGPELAPPYARQPFSLPGAAGPGPPTTPFLPPLHARERELGSLGAHLPPASLPPANPAAPQIDDELDNEVMRGPRLQRAAAW